MSQSVEADITCSACKNDFPTNLYRSIWVEYPENRSLIFNDEINAVTCSHCKHHERLNFPFLCTNVERGFALWYEPYHDPEIDKDMAGYRKIWGPDSFYAKAPRISDWEDFKKKLLEMEAKAPTKASPPLFAAEQQKKTAKGNYSEVKAAGEFVTWVCQNVKQRWPRIADELNATFKEFGVEDRISNPKDYELEFLLAIIAIGIQPLPNLLPSDQAIRIRKQIIQCISSPELGSYPNKTIEEYQNAWDQSAQQGNRPWDGISSVLYHKLEFKSTVQMESTKVINPSVILALTEKVFPFCGKWWKNFTQQNSIVNSTSSSTKTNKKSSGINPLLFFLYVLVFGCLIAYFLGYLPLEELLFDLTGVRFN
jgi:hypothetical protein